MSYILATTDFSAVSNNAVQYAAGIAAQHHLPLVLLHSFLFPAMMSEITIPASLIDDTRADAEKNMQLISKKMTAAHPSLNIKHVVAYGSFLDAVKNHADLMGAPWMLVMGNSNTQDDSSWFFSNLKSAGKDLGYPVLAVPISAFYTNVQRICYADDIELQENEHVLTMLKDITLRYGATLHVLNVQQDVSLHDDAYDIGEATKGVLADTNTQYHYRHQANIDDSIREFCTTENIDWLVLMPGKYPLIEGLFHKSHTKALAETMSIPLLLLH